LPGPLNANSVDGKPERRGQEGPDVVCIRGSEFGENPKCFLPADLSLVSTLAVLQGKAKELQRFRFAPAAPYGSVEARGHAAVQHPSDPQASAGECRRSLLVHPGSLEKTNEDDLLVKYAPPFPRPGQDRRRRAEVRGLPRVRRTSPAASISI
jgi:hypothetical protein